MLPSCYNNNLLHLYLCNQCLWLQALWVWFPLRRNVLNTTLCDNVCHIMLYRVHLTWVWFTLKMLIMIDTDGIGSCTSNYHTTTTVPSLLGKYYTMYKFIHEWQVLFQLNIPSITLQYTVTYHISQGSTIKHTIYLGQQILTYRTTTNRHSRKDRQH